MTKAEAQNDESILKEYVQIAKAICWKLIIGTKYSTNSFSYLQNRRDRIENEKKSVELRCATIAKCGTSTKKKTI